MSGKSLEVQLSSSHGRHHHVSDVSLDGDQHELVLNTVFDLRVVGGKTLLTDAHLCLRRGFCTALVGNNGVGKSSLLRVLGEGRLGNNNGADHVVVVEQITTLTQEGVEETDSTLVWVQKHDYALAKVRKALERMEDGEGEVDDVELGRLLDEELLLDESCAKRSKESLIRVGFSAVMMKCPFAQLSCGWRMRARLASALASGCAILALDEPTSSLDMEGIALLASLVHELSDMAVLIVSHNRAFLEETCSDVLLFQEGTLRHYPITFEEFWQSSIQQKAFDQGRFDTQTKREAQLRKQIAELQKKCGQGDRSAAGALSSRQNKLEQLEDGTCNKHANGKRYHRFSNKTFFYKWGPNVSGKLQPPKLEKPPRFMLEPASDISDFSDDMLLLSICDGAIGYTSSKPLISNVQFLVRPKSRIAIVGSNGSGKSSLLAALSSSSSQTLLSGERFAHPRVRIGVYNQLAGLDFPPHMSALDLIISRTGEGEMSPQEARDRLGAVGLGGDLATVAIESLSGGQRARLVFATINALRPHVLLLDEPETHLDLLTVAALIKSLDAWPGAFVIVTHDEYIAATCHEKFHVGKH